MRASYLRYTGFAALLTLAALALVPANLAAEVASSVTITGSTSVLRYQGSTSMKAALESELSLNSAGNQNVKGELELKSMLTGNCFIFDVPRAYVKVRFPWFRFTLGKTRVSWGDGFVFNAGDVIFGSMGTVTGGLAADIVRDETIVLAAAYIPLGDFSFLEAVIVPYPAGIAPSITGLGGAGFTFESTDWLDLGRAELDKIGGGIRTAFKLGSTTVESGFFTSSFGGAHRPYLSLHGHLLVDWNLSTSLAVPFGIPLQDLDWQPWSEWLGISGGLFHLVNLGLNRTLSFRLEAAVRPGALWEEATGEEAIETGLENAPVYGIDLFPEIAYSPSDTLSLQLRSLISPVDRSAIVVASVSWNVYQGLTVFSHLSVPVGDANDLYRWDQDYLTSWTTGLEFIF